MWGSIVYFFIVTLFLGFIIDLFIKDWKADLLEKIVMRIGTGILAFTLLGVLLNLIHIPIDWRIFLLISIIIFGAALYFRKESILNDFPKSIDFGKLIKNKDFIYSILVLVMFGFTAFMYISGSFNYPWLEDSDPYGYTMVSKYISEQKTFSSDIHFIHYAEPYTQGYQILMGTLHQTNESIYWNMKFFNALIISLSILFFFYFMRSFSSSKDIAFYSTFALFAIPCWVSHFVFSLNFNMALIPVMLYSLVNINKNIKWKCIFIITLASILINHANTAITSLIIIAIYFFNKTFVEEKIDPEIIISIFKAIILSLAYFIPAFLRHPDFFSSDKKIGGIEAIIRILESSLGKAALIFLVLIIIIMIFQKKHVNGILKKVLGIKNIKYKIFIGFFIVVLGILFIPQEKLLSYKGSGTYDYGLGDFFIAKSANLINNPNGVGIVLMTLFALGMIFILFNLKKLFSEKNFWMSMAFIWSIFSLIIIFGMKHSIMYTPFRMWTFFAIFASMIIGYTIHIIIKSVPGNNIKFIVLLILLISVIPTSFSQKYSANTSEWPEHFIFQPESQSLYVWMRDSGKIEKDSIVFNPCINPNVIFGYDMTDPAWDYDRTERDRYFSMTLEEKKQFLKKNGFEYIALGASCLPKQKISQEDLQKEINMYTNDTSIIPINGTQTELLFRIIV